MLVGRSASSVISGKVATRTQLIVVSATAICFILIAIFTPKEITVSMPGYSVEMDSKWPLYLSVPYFGTLWFMYVHYVGRYLQPRCRRFRQIYRTSFRYFMMMVVGGGIFPLLQQFISDAVGYMASYWLIIALLAYLLFYGLVGCKNVNKDIPVE